jgi:hypothetical protein
VAVQRERVHAESEAEEVEVLAGVSDAVGAPKPHRVVEVTVDGLGVVATGEEPLEVGIAGWDRSEVLGSVELASFVFVVAIETDGDDLVLAALALGLNPGTLSRWRSAGRVAYEAAGLSARLRVCVSDITG